MGKVDELITYRNRPTTLHRRSHIWNRLRGSFKPNLHPYLNRWSWHDLAILFEQLSLLTKFIKTKLKTSWLILTHRRFRSEKDPILISDNKLGLFQRIAGWFTRAASQAEIGKTTTMEVLFKKIKNKNSRFVWTKSPLTFLYYTAKPHNCARLPRKIQHAPG